MSPLPLRRRWAPALPTAGLLWAALLALPAPAATAAATALADPTRPPAGLAGITTGSGPGGGAVPMAQGSPSAPHSPHAAASQPVVPPLLPLVQALHLPQRGAASAIVDNRLVRAGDKVGARTVLSIDSQGVLLRAAMGNGTERLSLFGSAGSSGSSDYSGNAGKVPAGSVTVRSAASFTPARLPAPAVDADPPATASRTSAVESPAASPEPQVATKAKP